MGRIEAFPMGGLLGLIAFMMFHSADYIRKADVL